MDSKWIRITVPENIPLREGRAVDIGTRELAVFNMGDRYLAVDNRCPHNGGPLADGIVAGEHVVCPLHAWKVCLNSGRVKRPEATAACIQTYPVRVKNGLIEVKTPLYDEIAEEVAA